MTRKRFSVQISEKYELTTNKLDLIYSEIMYQHDENRLKSLEFQIWDNDYEQWITLIIPHNM
jgi:hypothetical protein